MCVIVFDRRLLRKEVGFSSASGPAFIGLSRQPSSMRMTRLACIAKGFIDVKRPLCRPKFASLSTQRVSGY